MAVPTVLDQSSSGAPALTGEDGSLYNVLKWALPQLGWSLAFDDATAFKAAFRNNPATGTGTYLKVSDRAADHNADARRARAEVFGSMSDIDAGTDAIYSVQRFFLKSTLLSATARNYTIIGDPLRFHLMVDAAGANYFRWYHAGDFKKMYLADMTNFICPLNSDTATGATTGTWGISAIAFGSAVAGTGSLVSDYEEGMLANFAGTASATFRLKSYDATIVGNAAAPGSRGSVLSPSNPSARIIVCEDNSPRGEIVGAMNPLRDQPHGTTKVTGLEINNGRSVADAIYFPTSSRFSSTAGGLGSVYIDISSDWSEW